MASVGRQQNLHPHSGSERHIKLYSSSADNSGQAGTTCPSPVAEFLWHFGHNVDLFVVYPRNRNVTKQYKKRRTLLVEALEALLVDGRPMNEDVFGTIIRCDETEALLGEELDLTRKALLAFFAHLKAGDESGSASGGEGLGACGGKKDGGGNSFHGDGGYITPRRKGECKEWVLWRADGPVSCCFCCLWLVAASPSVEAVRGQERSAHVRGQGQGRVLAVRAQTMGVEKGSGVWNTSGF